MLLYFDSLVLIKCINKNASVQVKLKCFTKYLAIRSWRYG